MTYKSFIIEKDETLSTNLYYIRKANGDTLCTENGVEITVESIEAQDENEVIEYINNKYMEEKKMSRRWYGNLNNRLEENRQFCETIEVGTGMTEYMYSDRHPYEVVEVKDQKHVSVRGLDHKKVGDVPMDNNWELVSNENNPVYYLTKRGNYWYWTVTVTSDILEGLEEKSNNERIDTMIFLCHQNIVADELKAKGKITRYHRANVSFGIADYHYDYEF